MHSTFKVLQTSGIFRLPRTFLGLEDSLVTTTPSLSASA